ncbi:MAG: shikimate kinase [Chryseolinea sp.]
MKIYLVGMPGSGKSTLGAQLAQRLNMEFIDLDKEIEKFEGNLVTDIFAAKGEDHFRKVESTLLIELSQSNKNFIMATGGGAPCYHGGMKIINENGLSIFLDEPLEVLITRLEKKIDRPLLNETDSFKRHEKLEHLRASRLDCYHQAWVTVKGATLSKILEVLEIRTQTQK